MCGSGFGSHETVIAVTNRYLCRRPFTEQIERVCRFHPRAVILREKDLQEEEYTALAAEVLKICRAYGVSCILHTYPEAARRLGCTSVHLPLPLLREYAAGRDSGKDAGLKIFTEIGTSVHSAEDALEAERLGATYMIAGHIYATDCKKGLPPRGTEFLRRVCRSVSVPVYAIGGIKLDKAQLSEICACGAEGACIMSGMMII